VSSSINVGAFVTLAQARSTIGLLPEQTDDDGLIIDMINRSTGLFEQYTGRKLYSRAYVNQLIDGTGEATAFLLEYPVTAVASIKTSDSREFSAESALLVFDGTGTQADSAFEVIVDADTGEIELTNDSIWPDGKAKIFASYTAGFTATTAPELAQAQLTQVAQWFFQRGRDPKLTGSSLGGVTTTLLAPDSESGGLVDEVRAILGMHRRVAPVA
jgi:hypothetical protein